MATGLVVSDAGGDIVQVEATKMDGKDEFILTGQLGDVMKESARAGLSLHPGTDEGAGDRPRRLREADPAHPRSGRGDPQGRPLGRRHHGHRHGLACSPGDRCGATWP